MRTPSHRLRAQTEENGEKEEARCVPAFPPWVLVRREVNWQPHALITVSTTVYRYVLPHCDRLHLQTVNYFKILALLSCLLSGILPQKLEK